MRKWDPMLHFLSDGKLIDTVQSWGDLAGILYEITELKMNYNVVKSQHKQVKASNGLNYKYELIECVCIVLL